MARSRLLVAGFSLALLAGNTGCLLRTRPVPMRTSTAKLQTADKAELVDYINRQATSIQTLNATVDIATSVGGEKKGKVTQYEAVRGYILLRKPDMLRMIGLFPIVHNKAFDMVSQDGHFQLSIPAQNKFYVGTNEVVHPAANPLENLRPQVIYNALLLPEINPQSDIAVLEDSIEIVYDRKKRKNLEQPDYVVDILRRDANNDWYLARKIIFDRTNLLPHQQLVYDRNGAVASNAIYQVYQEYNGVNFPNVIEISRPREEYSIRLTVDKLVINQPLRDEQFVLQQPPGSQLIDLDQPDQPVPSGAPPSAKKQANGRP
ncbi:MAG TPA: DUF4292 domain-containing protein [Terriglobales bacterium]|nr:DUF4292 domain-containing protein [Terriglobales bacterium]